MFTKTAQKQRGITLVETLVVTTLFAVVMYAIMSSVASFYQFNSYTIAQAYQVNNARRGVENTVRDIREMTFADDGTFPLISMGTTSISFYSDIDRDDSVELVRYTLASTTLYKYVYDAVGSPPIYSTTTPDETYTLSEYVQNNNQNQTMFRYYDETGALTTATSSVIDVRYIDVQVIVNVDPVRDPGEFMLRSSAALRNLKENY